MQRGRTLLEFVGTFHATGRLPRLVVSYPPTQPGKAAAPLPLQHPAAAALQRSSRYSSHACSILALILLGAAGEAEEEEASDAASEPSSSSSGGTSDEAEEPPSQPAVHQAGRAPAAAAAAAAEPAAAAHAPVCAFCGREMARPLVCASCRSYSYCSRACQVTSSWMARGRAGGKAASGRWFATAQWRELECRGTMAAG